MKRIYEPHYGEDFVYNRDGSHLYRVEKTISSVRSEWSSATVSSDHRRATEWHGAKILARSYMRRKRVGRNLRLGTPSLRGNYLYIPWLATRRSFHPNVWRKSNFQPDVSLRTKAINALISRRASLGESLAEGRSTIALLGNKASALVKALRDIRRGRISKALSRFGIRKKHLTGDLSERWLETQFAVLPLVEEVENLYNIATEGLRTNISYVSAHKQSDDSSDFMATYGGARTRLRATLHYNCKLYCKLDDRAHSIARQLGFDSPTSLAWDILPFSFVIDWFVPVGNFLQASSGRGGFTFVDGYDSLKVVGTAESHNSWDDYRHDVVFEIYSRKLLRSMPSPQLFVRTPLSTWHAATAAALIRKVFY